MFNIYDFDDRVRIRVAVKAYNAIRLTLEYEMREGRPIFLKKAYPQWDNAFAKVAERPVRE